MSFQQTRHFPLADLIFICGKFTIIFFKRGLKLLAEVEKAFYIHWISLISQLYHPLRAMIHFFAIRLSVNLVGIMKMRQGIGL